MTMSLPISRNNALNNIRIRQYVITFEFSDDDVINTADIAAHIAIIAL